MSEDAAQAALAAALRVGVLAARRVGRVSDDLVALIDALEDLGVRAVGDADADRGLDRLAVLEHVHLPAIALGAHGARAAPAAEAATAARGAAARATAARPAPPA